jgi:molybdopterin-synthase adenylyltransferase
MTAPRITLLGSQERALTGFLDSHPDGHERAAIVLFRRFDLPSSELSDSDRYIAVEVLPLQEQWLTSSSSCHVAFELKYFRDIFRRCAEEALVFGFAHNHPGGPSEFSEADDANEETLVTAIRNRNGKDIHFVALLWSQGTWRARVRSASSPKSPIDARHLLVIDRRLKIHLDAPDGVEDELYSRQGAAFGRPFVRHLQSLRVAVVGAGGTGSPVITLLARAGVGEIIAIDGDDLERSNLNRVRGATASDVDKNKAAILKRFVESLGLPLRVDSISSFVDLDPRAVDAVASCDVVFGCTDDQIGREILNAALYVYSQAYIDLGLGGSVSEDNVGGPHLRYHFGRVSTVMPECGECLFCQGVLRDGWIRREYALRVNPNLTEEEARERYIEGGGDQAPGVGPFTSAVADYGVATLFDLVRPFRKFPPELRWDFFQIDFVRMRLRSTQGQHNPDCPYCVQRTYLLKREDYRLGRPALGKRRACV